MGALTKDSSAQILQQKKAAADAGDADARDFIMRVSQNTDPSRAKEAALAKSWVDGWAKQNQMPTPPDLTDEALQQAAKNASSQLGGLRGRRSTFLTGQSASSSYAPAFGGKKPLLGG